MALYEWKGVTADGRTLKGIRDADNPKALKAVLRKDGVFLLELLEEQAAASARARAVDLRRIFRRVTAMDVAITTRQLATLVNAGIALTESLALVIKQIEHPDLKRVFTRIREKVNEGSSLADALAEHPKLFTPLYINMVHAGESSGTLEAVLARLADFTESSVELRNKVVGALAYPILMSCIGIVINTIMMVVVVPKVTAIFDDFGRSLPWYTETLIFVSRTLSHWWWAMALAVGGAVYGFRRWLATENGRATWDRYILHAPVFGRLILMLAISRFTKTLSTLLASGVTLLKAMDITKNVLGNVELKRVIEEASSSIKEGESIAAPLERSGRFDPIVTGMIAVGERSGQLEQMLLSVANAYDSQIEGRITVLTSLLGPVMILLMGGTAAAINLSILMPLLQLNQFIQ